MQEWGIYILSGIFFLIICGIYFFLRINARKKKSGGRQKYIRDALELAFSQFAEFNIRLPEAGGNRAGNSGLIEGITDTTLLLDVNGYIPDDWTGKTVDVFFRTQKEDGPIFYAFNSVIEKIEADYQNSHIVLAMPDHLRIEKKRHFIRVTPDKNDIRVIGVWKLKSGKRLPKSSTEIGPPATHYKPCMESEPVQVENISGAGLALRFSEGHNEELSGEFVKGNQILCLIVYVLEEKDKPIAFWCTGEIMNSRLTTGAKQELVLGLEFTNWAVLETASSEIHWAHSSPSRGARPILQWVEQIEKKQSKHSE